MSEGWHGYVLVSGLPPGWTHEQREIAWQALKRLGAQTAKSPAQINHIWQRLDGKALIMEALFDATEITRNCLVDTVAMALNVNPTAVNQRLEYTVFAPGGTWKQSRLAAQAYLFDHQDDWEPDIK